MQDPGCAEWVKRAQWISALTGGILSLIHPEQYLVGRTALLRLAEQPGLSKDPVAMARILEDWTSPFNGLSVIVNWATPVHRDVQGRDSWLDMLVTHGPYSDCQMEFQSLGIRIAYSSGTIVGLCGKVVPHAASHCVGERACIAYYMRDNVHARLGVPASSWMDVRQSLVTIG